MGLQGQLNDVGSDSVALYLIAVIATTISHLRSILHSLLRPISLQPSPPSPSSDDHHTDPVSSAGSGLSDLILLSEHLSLNRHLSYTYSTPRHSPPPSPSSAPAHCCLVCLSRLRDGETVRSLPCRHVFHKDCFEGWIHHCPTLNFTCPLCRSPLMLDDDDDRRRRCLGVGNDVVSWFDGCSMNY